MTRPVDTPWQPRVQTTTELIDPAPVAALASLLDDGLPAPAPGDPLPPLWHWVALPRWAASGALGPDGHLHRGNFLPPVTLPRRMFAGGSARFVAPLRVGDTVRREAEVLAVTEKSGRSGPLVIVAVRTRLYDGSGVLTLEEVQDLVYRDTAAPSGDRQPTATTAEPGVPLRRLSDNEWGLHTDASLLMRFSALTANAHRIHYDWPYATDIGGYPGLVVHGPLQALVLAEIHRLAGGAPVVALRHQGHAPLFCGQPATLRATAACDGVTLELFGPQGTSAGPNATLDLTTR